MSKSCIRTLAMNKTIATTLLLVLGVSGNVSGAAQPADKIVFTQFIDRQREIPTALGSAIGAQHFSRLKIGPFDFDNRHPHTFSVIVSGN